MISKYPTHSNHSVFLYHEKAKLHLCQRRGGGFHTFILGWIAWEELVSTPSSNRWEKNQNYASSSVILSDMSLGKCPFPSKTKVFFIFQTCQQTMENNLLISTWMLASLEQSRWWKLEKIEPELNLLQSEEMFERTQIWWAGSHEKRTWLIDSESNPQTWHLGSNFIPLAMISSTTGTTPDKAFQINIFFCGDVYIDHTSFFRQLMDGHAAAYWMSKEFLDWFCSQYLDLTEYSTLLLIL